MEEEQSELPIATEIPSQEKIRWAALLNPVPWSFSVTPEIPWKFTAGLLGILVSIAAVRMGVLGGRLYFLQRLKSSTLPAPEALARVFRRLCVELEVRCPVRLQLSSVAGSALLLGFFKPMVLLHVNEAERESEATEQILRHELAHLNRGDDWLNLIQQCTHAALFFHPAVWWIGKQLSLEREIACDDFVLQRGGTRRAYALLLTDLAQRMQRRPLLLAPGASNNKSQLQQRIKMILDTKRNASPYLAKSRLGLITSAAALAAVLAIYSAPRIVLAESEVRASAAPSVTTTISSTPTVAIASTPTATIVSTPTASVEFQPALAPVAINTTPGVPTIIAQVGVAPSGPKYKPDGLPSEDIQPRVYRHSPWRQSRLARTSCRPERSLLPEHQGLRRILASSGKVMETEGVMAIWRSA